MVNMEEASRNELVTVTLQRHLTEGNGGGGKGQKTRHRSVQ